MPDPEEEREQAQELRDFAADAQDAAVLERQAGLTHYDEAVSSFDAAHARTTIGDIAEQRSDQHAEEASRLHSEASALRDRAAGMDDPNARSTALADAQRLDIRAEILDRQQGNEAGIASTLRSEAAEYRDRGSAEMDRGNADSDRSWEHSNEAAAATAKADHLEFSAELGDIVDDLPASSPSQSSPDEGLPDPFDASQSAAGEPDPQQPEGGGSQLASQPSDDGSDSFGDDQG